MRFIYDRITWSKVKVNDAIRLPRTVCLNKFMLTDTDAHASHVLKKSKSKSKSERVDHIYDLKVVMYHRGKSTEVGAAHCYRPRAFEDHEK